MNLYTIEKLDNKGSGITYIDNKITFVKNALPGEVVELKLIKESKKYNEAIVVNYDKTSPNRLPAPCPYFNSCGGCDLLHMNYENSLLFKKEKLSSIIYKYANIKYDIEVIPSPNNLSYRNKITLKVINGKYGYYETKTHHLIEVTSCLLAEPAINKLLKDFKLLHVKDGEVTIRSNYNNELLIWIKSKNQVTPDITSLKNKHKIVGIILNDTVLSGSPTFIEIINHQLFQVSYDSFFQVNRHICSILFDLVASVINEGETIVDLYCGVGTLGINASSKARKAFGIEIVKNAVLNAITNSKINKKNNIYYMLGDVSECLPKIKEHIDTMIVDPPRAGLDKITKETIISFKPNKIVYVSCDPMTLARDLKELSPYYDIVKIKGLDMFPFTEHVETFCVLNKR